jgi:outer membrane protein OmpA-like peptidoglycan-associated protein
MIENTCMFGLNGNKPRFDDLFQDAGKSWARRGYIASTVNPQQAKDDRFLAELFKVEPPVTNCSDTAPVQKPPSREECRKAISTDQISVYFGSGSSTLNDDAKRTLDEKASSTKRFATSSYFCVEGNTDDIVPSGMSQDVGREYNVQLSEKRAQAVVAYLAQRDGRDTGWFTSFGNGSGNPIVPNSGAAARAKNRRTEIRIVTRN